MIQSRSILLSAMVISLNELDRVVTSSMTNKSVPCLCQKATGIRMPKPEIPEFGQKIFELKSSLIFHEAIAIM